MQALWQQCLNDGPNMCRHAAIEEPPLNLSLSERVVFHVCHPPRAHASEFQHQKLVCCKAPWDVGNAFLIPLFILIRISWLPAKAAGLLTILFTPSDSGCGGRFASAGPPSLASHTHICMQPCTGWRTHTPEPACSIYAKRPVLFLQPPHLPIHPPSYPTTWMGPSPIFS